MQIHFYVHKSVLDKLNSIIKDTFDDSEDKLISAYRTIPKNFIGSYAAGFLYVTIGYEDFMKIEEYLCFSN